MPASSGWVFWWLRSDATSRSDTSARAASEKTVVGIYFGPPPDRQVTQFQVPAFFGIRANIDIPAGSKDYKIRGSFTIPADVEALTGCIDYVVEHL